MAKRTKHVYGKIAIILLPIVILFLAGTCVWAFHENQDKNSILIKAENQYQRAFNDLSSHIGKLQDKLGESLVLQSREQLVGALTTVWRLSYAAQNDVGQLPMSLMPFDSVHKLVAKTGVFAYEVGIRDLNSKPLTDAEYKTLSVLYERTKSINKDLDALQQKVIDKGLRWMDIELLIATQKEPMDNGIIDGFTKVNQKVEQFPEVDFGPSINNEAVNNAERFKRLKGKKISPEEAKQKFATVLGINRSSSISATLNNKGDYKSYIMKYVDKADREICAEITETGGYVLWMDYDKSVTKAKLTKEQALSYAQKFLNRIKYTNMIPTSFDEEGNIVTYSFAHREGKVLVYPETLSVKISLDNGDIIGLSASDYVFNQSSADVGLPSLSLSEAKKMVSKRVKIYRHSLSFIYNELGKEALCYEFLVKAKNGEKYRVFINGKSGVEETVQKFVSGDF